MILRFGSLHTLVICLGFLFGVAWSQKTELRIQFLVPQETSSNRVYHNDATIPAAQMAVRDINNHPDYLPNYDLTVEFSDSQCDASEGTWQMIKSVLDTSSYNETKIIAFLGGSCSLVTEPTAALSGRLYKVVQISYASASPILSDRDMYPLFYRTYPSQNTFNSVYYALMNTYNWCIVATLHQTVNLFSLAVTNFHERYGTVLNGSNCDVENDKPILFSFTGDPEIPLKQIKSKDVRIIIGFFYEDKAVVVLCYAKNMGLIGDRYQWIIPGWYTDNWWKMADTMDWSDFEYNCTSDDIRSAAAYILLVDFNTYPLDPDTQSLSGYTTPQFRAEYSEFLNDFRDSDLYKGDSSSLYVAYETLSYDAVWTLAIALNKTENVIQEDGISLADFQYARSSPDNPTEFNDSINNYISYNLSRFVSQTDFEGVSGRVQFDENGDRFGYSILYQYRIVDGYLNRTRLGLHSYENMGLNITFDEAEPLWRTGEPPADRSTPMNITINSSLVIVMNLFIAIGIVVAVGLLVFNTVTVMMPLMKNSAPLINTVIIVGCILLMSTCILLGIDSANPKVVDGELDLTDIPDSAKKRYATICTVRLWFLTIGFTLSFGALFAKTWQVYRVYTNPTKLKDKPFKIWNFLIIMGIQLVLDILFLSIWTGIYNFTRDIDEKTRGNTVQRFEFCRCENFSYLIGALYVYKGLTVIFGLFLAYESRNVKYFYINDSRFVSIAMYIVVILIGISAPLSLVLSEERFVDPAYGVATFMITLACMCCLLILYIPKFYYMSKGAETMIPKTKMDAFTPVDRLQLGRSEVNPEDMQNADKEIEELKEQVQKKDFELQELEKRRGSDQDSGVMCTTDETIEGSNHGSPTTVENNTCNTTMETIVTSHSSDGGETGLVHDAQPEKLEGKIEEVNEDERQGKEDPEDGTQC